MEINSKHTKILLNETQEFNKSRTTVMLITVGLRASGLGLRNSHGQSPDVWKLLMRFLNLTWT